MKQKEIIDEDVCPWCGNHSETIHHALLAFEATSYIFCLLWTIWQRRNLWVFENKKQHLQQTLAVAESLSLQTTTSSDQNQSQQEITFRPSRLGTNLIIHLLGTTFSL
ncbi:hypothetical protein AAZX31_15G171500 [Glycine max]|nr:hypothetical protein GLYMA_15G180850v4 [Glycine max]KAG4381601.1 hypothetical protein GLYMA_15G180850v4 [Glycine max]KAH1147744.1 hypothetical protein GYH30_042744 [Glycine max]KAH1147745.1 hypothetical protein GYH30_042744 [Glycine max]